MKRCEAKTLEGKKCKCTAKYPLKNPKYCGHHNNKPHQKGG